MSEDPQLVEELTVPLIQGIQESDVAACVKHFAVNNQETERLMVETEVDDRALREIYLPGFQAAVEKAGCYTLMGAYNRLRGEHCCESKYLLNQILREEWNFDGAVISDWGAVHNTKLAADAGLDIEMSVTPDFDDYFMANPLLEAVRSGEIKEDLIDLKVKNILRTMLRLNMLGEGQNNRKCGAYNTAGHRDRVLKAAREAVILLKNEGNRLPLSRKNLKTLAVIGQNAEVLHSGGGGSAEIKALYEISPLMGIRKALGGNVEVTYAKGYYIPSKKNEMELNWQQHSLERTRELTEEEKQEAIRRQKLVEEEIRKNRKQLLVDALELAARCDEVIIIGGLNHDYDLEGQDRTDMKLPYGQDALIEEVLKINPKAVIVMLAGSPVQMSDWSSKAKAIVWNYYNGMEGGTALAEVLLGDVNPSAKLPETLPRELEDSPAHKLGEFGTKETVAYKEDIFVGYRYYDSFDAEPEFCFGHGLSYTSFEYKNIVIEIQEEDKNVTVRIHVTIKNTGKREGAEILQVYVADKQASVQRPAHELKGFTKVFLQEGEERNVTITLHEEAFGFYNPERQCFITEPGEFEIQIGSSSRDIRLTKNIKLSSSYQY
jgi:beta-glucosidase